MSSNGRRQGVMADWVRTASPPLRKNRFFAAQLLLCKVLGRFAKVRTGRPPGPVILKLKNIITAVHTI